MKKLTTTLLFSFLVITFVSPVHAQVLPVASPLISPEQDLKVNEEIIEHVKKVKENTDSTVMGVRTIEQNRFGIMGILEKIVGSTLQIKTLKGKIRVVELDPTAVLLNNQKTITKEEIELNSTVLAMGEIGTDQTYLGKRMVITTQNLTPTRRRTIVGNYVKSTAKALTINPLHTPSAEKSIPLTIKTTFYNQLKQTTRRTDLVAGDLLIIVVNEEDEDNTALRIYSLTTKSSAIVP